MYRKPQKSKCRKDFQVKPSTGLCEYLMVAPDAKACKQAREHLRYWPYVKEFHPVGCFPMLVVHVMIGQNLSEEKWNRTLERATKLMDDCLRQYKTLMIPVQEMKTFHPAYHDGQFLRPDDLVTPFAPFIKEVEGSRVPSSNTKH